MGVGIELAERGWIPDILVRRGIRQLDADRLRVQSTGERLEDELQKFAAMQTASPLAVATEKANLQHYEVPAQFFTRVLGPHLKYSSCFYETGNETLEDAERKALELTCQHAELEDGQAILELGCGWGSLSLWMAARFPNARIVAISNSHSQREFIEARCRERGLKNLQIQTRDINVFEAAQQFDRVVSVEMFEHVRNHSQLFQRISRWLKSDGKLFFHIFCHRRFAYLFEDSGDDDWMARYFFTGGMMPAENLFLLYQDHLQFEQKWWWNGMHYSRTAEHWLKNMDSQRSALRPLFRETYGAGGANLWFQRWRIFFMACAELFAYGGGEEWGVSHYLFRNRIR